MGRCYDLSETPPYGPWVEALGDIPRDDPAPAPPDLAGGGGASQAVLFEQVAGWFAAAVADRPLVLLLEDLHWADQASLDLLRVVARRAPTLRLLLLVTYRADELTRRHPLYALLPTLDREAHAVRLALRRFDAAGGRALVTARYALPATDVDRLVAWLARRAEGNAFFTTQLLRALEDEGALTRAATGWALGDLGGVGLPESLRQMLDARVDRLGEEARELLALAAVIGQEAPLALWAAVAGANEEVLLALLERGVEDRLLAGTPDGARFAHALVREALYEGILPIRRRALHRRVAEALLATPTPDPDAMAYHLRQAGDPRATEWLVRAGERAWRAYAWLTAAERYEAALALPESVEADQGQRAVLLLTLAQLYLVSDPARGIVVAAESARLATEAGDRVLAAAALFDQGTLRSQAGDHRAGLAEMERAWPMLEGLDPRERARLPIVIVRNGAPEEDGHRGMLVLYLAAVGRCREALTLGGVVAPGAADITPTWQQGLAMAHALLGEPDRSWAASAAAHAAYLAAGQHRNVATTLTQELEWAMHYRGDQPSTLARLAAETEHAVVRATSAAPRASPRLSLLPFFWLTGRWAEAHAAARLALARPHYRDWIWPGPWFARIARAQGDRDTAWELVRQALPGGPDADPHAECTQALALSNLAALLALDTGDLPTARIWLEAHDRWRNRSGAVLGLADGQLGWAVYHRASGDPARAHDLADAALRHASAPRQPLALAAAHRLLGELDTAAGRHTEAAAHLAAALALADACEAPYERALTLLALAALRAAEGNRGEAEATLGEVRDLLEPLEARPALARAEALALQLVAAPLTLPFGLTAREAEVLRLVAEGLPDSQVADRLFVSRHTVSTHLRAVYGKLGVTSRTAAARLAADHGLA